MAPKVSVSLICYNQEAFIEECLRSVLAQKTNFDFELVIGDDGSTDRTKILIEAFCKMHSNIRFINRPVNIGLQKNVHDVFKKCSGNFIALIEGDDFWIDEMKLQKQVDFLEDNPDCSVCFTNSFTFQDGSYAEGKVRYSDNKPKEKFDLHYFLTHDIAVTNNTKMFRRSSLLDNLPDIFFDTIKWDWLLHILHGLEGQFGYLDEITLAYRRHDKTIIHENNIERISKDGVVLISQINNYLPAEYHEYFKYPKSEINALAFYYLKKGKWSLFLINYFKYLRNSKLKEIKFRDEFYKLRKINSK